MSIQINPYLLIFFDITLTVFHLIFIVFVLIGWFFKKLRLIHFYSVLVVAISWFVLGLYYGFGYCPITDCHWRIKEMRGEYNLPYSFIEYIIEKPTGLDVSTDLVNYATLGLFLSVFVISVYFRYIKVCN